MGANQSDIENIQELRRNYGIIKQTQVEIMGRMNKLDIDRAIIDQQFQKQCADLKNSIDDLKKDLRQAKHDYTISNQTIDEEQTELRHRLQEMQESISNIKIGEMRYSRGSIINHRHP